MFFCLTLNNPALKGLRMAPIICDCKNACLYEFVRHFNFLLSILLFLFSFSKMSSNPTYNSFISVLPFFWLSNWKHRLLYDGNSYWVTQRCRFHSSIIFGAKIEFSGTKWVEKTLFFSTFGSKINEFECRKSEKNEKIPKT